MGTITSPLSLARVRISFISAFLTACGTARPPSRLTLHSAMSISVHVFAALQQLRPLLGRCDGGSANETSRLPN